MDIRVVLLTGSFLCSVAFCDVTETNYVGSEGVLHISPYSVPEVPHPSPVSCARACAADGKCVVFSYSQSNGSCVLSRRPDDDATVYDTPSPVWDTYNSVCPKDKGYVQYDFHQPPLCLRYVGETLNHSDAGERCQKDGAKLVRVKTMQVYNIVKQILIDAGCVNKMIWVGADDRAVEGQHVWSDGTSLARFTDMWRDPTEGGKASEDCISVSSTKLLIDTSCDLLKTFMCQYDI